MRISDWSSDVCSSDLVIEPTRGLLGSKPLDATQLEKIAACLHDRMTETVVDASFDGAGLFASLPGTLIQTLDVVGKGQAALVEANSALGLAMSADEIEYLKAAFQQLGHKPHDHAQIIISTANTDPCRQHILNDAWVNPA